MDGAEKGIRVTVEDLATGQSEIQEVAWGDYLLICVGPCRRTGTTAYASGTHVVTIKGVRSRG